MPFMFSYANDQLNQSLEHTFTLSMTFFMLTWMSGICHESSRKLLALSIFHKNFICLFMTIPLIMTNHATEI